MLFRSKLWLGDSIHSGDREFRVPDEYPLTAVGSRIDDDGHKYIRVKGVRWFTNINHGRRHQPLSLMTMADNKMYSKHKTVQGHDYEHYDNYDAIEIPYTDAIPADYDGVMGVPITFLDKYNPDQFEIIGSDGFDSMPPTKVYPTKTRYLNGKVAKSNTGTLGPVIRETEFGKGTYFDVGYPVKQLYKRIFIRRKSINEDNTEAIHRS